MKKISNKKIFVCATEQSGDNIGEKILKDLKIKYSSIVINGVGGSKMNQFMNKQYYSIKNFHSMGIIEILFSIKKYLKMINSLSDHIIKEKYDLLITIDSPDFNFPLAKKIKKIGFNGKIIHIVAPTVWAWRESRAKKFSEIFDVIFTLFDFENKYFEKYNLKSICIGHPIFYIKKSNKNKHKKNFIAFLPGSRKGEIKSLFKYFQMAYEHLSINNSNLSIFIPTLPHLKKQIQHLTKEWNINTEITTNNKEIEYFFSKSKIALVCSGTATLEIAKREIPQLIIYKFNFLTELIASFFVKVKFANIINIIENNMIIPELLNSKLNTKNFIKYFDKLLNDEKGNNIQTKKVKKRLIKIEKINPPHKIVVKSISDFLR